MKGKKYTAAEKHFDKERIKYEKEIKYLKDRLLDSQKELTECTNKISEYEATISSLNDWIERLLQYTELSKEDIKDACEKDKRINQVIAMMDRLHIIK